jgi:alpha-D-ribose 1-methylphosphonate 5-triphosphate synthase subunit PhnG
MGILAKAAERELLERWKSVTEPPEYTFLREPETGLVMVRGRAGGDGMRFSLGEISVTRCTVRLEDGTHGHGYVAGAGKRHAELAAVIDALMQTSRSEEIERLVLSPLANEMEARKQETREKVAATKVDFFTMVRGDG